MRDAEKEMGAIRDDIGVQDAKTEKFVEKVEEWKVCCAMFGFLSASVPLYKESCKAFFFKCN